MNAQRHQRVSELFLAAQKRAPPERAAFLASECGEDAELRDEVESLLARHERLSGFLGRPALGDEFHVASAVAPEPASGLDAQPLDGPRDGGRLPERIGHYRILGLLGRGGMGIVYLAEQENPRRTVALKLIQPGVASPARLKRFEHEAQLLGRLQHPGIARIYEAGTADAGFGTQPFFAMEYVRGPSLTEFARQRQLGTRERLALFVRVCEAVQHAHQRGIIHRDLKPANILVDDSGQPRVLDFGVARATDADVQAGTLATASGEVIGTLPYMSPEQLACDSDALDTRSDVYALGVLLYELLTGRLPFDLSHKPLAEAARILREVDPARMSTTDRRFRGDVETLVSKALEKDRDRRYSSAAELALDVERFLRHEPIVARPASTLYQISRFARRNRVLVAGAAGVLLALILGVAGTSWQAVRATRQRDFAESARKQAQIEARRFQSTYDFLEDVLTSVAPDERGRDVRVVDVLERASRTVDSAFAEDPEVAAVLERTIGSIYRTLWELPQAEAHLTRALALHREHLGSADRRTAGALWELSIVLGRTGRAAESVQLSAEAVRLLAASVPEDDIELLRATREHGSNLRGNGELEQAAAVLGGLLATCRRVRTAPDWETTAVMGELGLTLLNLRRLDESAPLLEQALVAMRPLMGERSLDVASLEKHLANLRRLQGRHAEARALIEHALDSELVVLGMGNRRSLGTLRDLGNVLWAAGSFDEGEVFLRACLAGAPRTLEEGRGLAANTLHNLARMLDEAGRRDAAIEMYGELLELYGEAASDMERRALALALHERARLLALLGRLHEAEVDAARSVETACAMVAQEHPDLARFRLHHGLFLADLGRFAEAEPEVRAGGEGLLGELPPNSPQAERILQQLVSFYDASGQPETADLYAARMGGDGGRQE